MSAAKGCGRVSDGDSVPRVLRRTSQGTGFYSLEGREVSFPAGDSGRQATPLPVGLALTSGLVLCNPGPTSCTRNARPPSAHGQGNHIARRASRCAELGWEVRTCGESDPVEPRDASPGCTQRLSQPQLLGPAGPACEPGWAALTLRGSCRGPGRRTGRWQPKIPPACPV